MIAGKKYFYIRNAIANMIKLSRNLSKAARNNNCVRHMFSDFFQDYFERNHFITQVLVDGIPMVAQRTPFLFKGKKD